MPRRRAQQEYVARRKLAHALPILGDSPVPEDRDLSVADDRDTLVSIVKLFLRSWPYIKPQFFGRWVSTACDETKVADASLFLSDGFSFTYLPFSTIRRADNILYLDAGRIVENGDHETLMAMPDGRYRAFVEAESHLSSVAKE